MQKNVLERLLNSKSFSGLCQRMLAKTWKGYDPSMEINGMQIYSIENLHDNFNSILSTFQCILKTNLVVFIRK